MDRGELSDIILHTAKKLSVDELWKFPCTKKGQTTGDAPGIEGEWITIRTKGAGRKTDTAKGRIIAVSDFFEPLSTGSLIVPGLSGRIYFPTEWGFLTLRVRPKGEQL